MRPRENTNIYTQTLVTFLDILGFREMVKNDVDGSYVKGVVNHLRDFGTMDLDERSYYGFTTYHFSDSVVRCTPLLDGTGSQSDLSIFINEIEELTYIQGELSGKGIQIRGGIACGDVYIGENEVFGPAFIDAYTLESKHACYPRVVVHPNLLSNYAISGRVGYGVYADDGLRLTREDNDGFHFVDYLKNFPREIHSDPYPDCEEIALSYMEPRKERIENEISKHEVLSTVRTKYIWLGKYHDITAREFLGEDATSVLINRHM